MDDYQLGKYRRISNLKGFTLVEVLIAIAIFSIGFFAITAMQIHSINGNSSARRTTEATILAEAQLERLLGLPYSHNDLDPGLNPHQVTQNPYTMSWDVTETDLDGDGTNDSKTVNIVVNWRYRGDRNVTLMHIVPEF
jgi:prepilin-type N-terminal cleavage/methylation domain-containing protein